MFEADLPLAARFIIAFLIVIALIGVAAWIIRRFAGPRLGQLPRSRQPRLAVLDAAPVDGRRQLVLVRRDNFEHLLLIGGPSDVVVETNIVRAAPVSVPGRDVAGQDSAQRRDPKPQMREAAPKTPQFAAAPAFEFDPQPAGVQDYPQPRTPQQQAAMPDYPRMPQQQAANAAFRPRPSYAAPAPAPVSSALPHAATGSAAPAFPPQAFNFPEPASDNVVPIQRPAYAERPAQGLPQDAFLKAEPAPYPAREYEQVQVAPPVQQSFIPPRSFTPAPAAHAATPPAERPVIATPEIRVSAPPAPVSVQPSALETELLKTIMPAPAQMAPSRAPAAPAFSPPPAVSAPATTPVASKTVFDNLEEEMASLLGRGSGKA